MRAPSQRRALGALFLVLAFFFAGIAVTAARADAGRAARWVVALTAAVLALWVAGLAVNALRRR